METLKEAKNHLRENYERGVNCPCCGQFVKKYKRSVYARIAKYLINLYHLNKHDSSKYFSVDEIKVKGDGDFAKLLYWNLIEEMPKNETDTHKRTSGFWRITPLGKDFVENKIKISKYALVYNSKLLGFEGEQTSIIECLGKDFNYQELISL